MDKPVYIPFSGKYYPYPLDWCCLPNINACKRCSEFGGFTDDMQHFLCKQIWKDKVIKDTV